MKTKKELLLGRISQKLYKMTIEGELQPLKMGEPVPLLLPGHVTNIPTDAVHWEETAARISIADSCKRTQRIRCVQSAIER